MKTFLPLSISPQLHVQKELNTKIKEGKRVPYLKVGELV